MGTFTPHYLPVQVRHDDDGLPFVTLEDVRYKNEITDLTIPAGFRLDFASVPRPLWWLFPRVGRYARAALVHDALYREDQVGRVRADAIFLDIMKGDATPWWQRWLMYAAVRCFGWIGWNKLRENASALSLLLLALLLFSCQSMAQCPGGVCPLPQGGPGQRMVAPYQSQNRWTPPAEVRRSLDSVVRIVHDEGGGTSFGSGVVVAHDETSSYVLTCAHLFTSPGRTRVSLTYKPAVAPAAARIVEKDEQHDVVLLRCGRLPVAAVEVDLAATSGELYAGGFGGNGVLRIVRGAIRGRSIAQGASAPSVRIGGSVRSGDSGGPLFNARGRVVGVVWGERDGETYAMVGGPVRRVLSRIAPRAFPPKVRPITPVQRAPNDPGTPQLTTPASQPAPRCGDDCPCVKRFDALGSRLDNQQVQIKQLVDAVTKTAEGTAALAERVANQPQGVPLEKYEVDQERSRGLLGHLGNRVAVLASTSADAAKEVGRRKLAEVAVGALGLGSPIGVALLLGRWFIRKQHRGGDREAPPADRFPGSREAPQ